MTTLKAIEWSYESDLNAPPARWTCTFLDQSGHLPVEQQSQAGTRYVSLDVAVQGQEGRLLDGVVRQWGVRETPTGVVSTAEGLDLKAELLDFRPQAPVTFRGVRVLRPDEAPTSGRVLRLSSDCTGAEVRGEYFETFQSAVSSIAEAMGYTAVFDCYDYVLGTDVVWEPTRTANDVLAELAAPFNATERGKLDVFVEPNKVLRFVERGRTAPPVVEVDYLQLLEREVTEFTPQPPSDVLVEGATYTFVEPDCSREAVEGAVVIFEDRPAPYTLTERRLEYESYDVQSPLAPSNVFVGSFDVLVAERTTTKYFDENGRQLRQVETVRWHNYVLRDPRTGQGKRINPKARLETTETHWEYQQGSARPTRMIRTTFVQDSTVYVSLAADGTETVLTANVGQFTEREEQETTYDKAGDPVTITSTTYAATEPKPTPSGQASPTPLLLVRKVEETFSWSGGMRIRSVTTREFDTRIPGRQLTSRTFTEVAPGRGRPTDSIFFADDGSGPVGVWGPHGAVGTPTASRWPPVRGGVVRTATTTVRAGGDAAQVRHVFPTLARQEDCAYFRARLLAEATATRYGVTLRMLPDLNVREGVMLRVLHQPARWRTNEFFVHGRSMQHTSQGATMTIRGVAWF